jgi:hypothetical protein
MNDPKDNGRGLLPGRSDRRATVGSGEAAKREFAERIARQVMSMTPEEVDAYIVEHGLSHLADPERMAALLELAVSATMHEEEMNDCAGLELASRREPVFDPLARQAQLLAENRRKH